MSTILVTGASGFIGHALTQSLAAKHTVIAMSRHAPKPKLDVAFVRGDFQCFEALQALNRFAIDTAVHLAAVTGGCSERDGIMVNVEGTRVLMRYLMDHGCRKFVLASSIAAVGFQSVKFRPRQMPIPDEHPCLDRDGYGVAKYLMEEVTRYYSRQRPEIDVINLRLASVCPDDPPPQLKTVCPIHEWHLGALTIMLRSDAARVFTAAAETPYKPGVRVMNATGPKAWVKDPVAQILRGWYGTDVDVSHFEQAGHEFDSVYDVSRIRQELGFVAERTPDVVFGPAK